MDNDDDDDDLVVNAALLWCVETKACVLNGTTIAIMVQTALPETLMIFYFFVCCLMDE